MAKPGIDAENANRVPDHGPLITPSLPSGQKLGIPTTTGGHGTVQFF
jgi:hypothetical protein